MLGIFGFTQFVFFALVAILLAFLYMPYIVAGAFGLRLIVQLIVYGRTMRKFKEKGFLFLVPLFEIFLLIIQPMLSLSNLVSKPGQWR